MAGRRKNTYIIDFYMFKSHANGMFRPVFRHCRRTIRIACTLENGALLTHYSVLLSVGTALPRHAMPQSVVLDQARKLLAPPAPRWTTRR